ncbi:uncharacterized protein BP5553_06711 [Venustampulla echinocandica]|uniref:Phytase A n=1 Tax=Venustampulla echinocandica TaxID=2656787 RepID=A0A370TKQ4_9HELO|nr:uncharacterized protein BP5553_06711 [Venustampulla echinocandica]RDL36099.1 hypothetical protein BP5553_06711 [Venustampulla echinocandica]
MKLTSVLLLHWLPLLYGGVSAQGNVSAVFDDPITGYLNQPQVTQNFGQSSPFFSLAQNNSDATPPGCTITQAHILSRHGARFPTKGKTTTIKTALAKVSLALTNATGSLTGDFAFLNTFNYSLGQDNLTGFGQQELFNSGIKFAKRYEAAGKGLAPFVRAAGSPRVEESALNFTMGWNSVVAASALIDGGSILVISEEEGVNNTLHVESCPAFENTAPFNELGDTEDQIWIDIFAPPIRDRLNANIPGANFDVNDTVAMMDLCPFETVATPTGEISPVCKLFTDDEFVSYSFLQSVDKFFGDGPGNKFGSSQGAGFVNELLARMTNTAVQDQTSTNTTLDSQNATFPLGLALYADFSHDKQMISIMTAMGLFNGSVSLGGLKSTDRQTSVTSGFSVAKLTPFSARMYFEKMTCEGSAEEMVRVLVNDAVQPLEFCGGDALGRCTLTKFVESQGVAKSGGAFSEC